jgi:hypothetical protein
VNIITSILERIALFLLFLLASLFALICPKLVTKTIVSLADDVLGNGRLSG